MRNQYYLNFDYVARALAAIAAMLFVSQLPSRQGARVAIRVDASARQGPMKPVWAFFGYDEPNYTYMGGRLRVG